VRYCSDNILVVQKETENSHFRVGIELGTVTRHEFTRTRKKNSILSNDTLYEQYSSSTSNETVVFNSRFSSYSVWKYNNIILP